MTKTEKAIENHKSFRSCSESVLCAFREEIGMSEADAAAAARPMAGGRMGKCGAVLAAEYVLKEKYGEASKSRIEEFEREFISMNRSVMCRELKGGLTGKPLRSCRGCVADAAELLERTLSEEQ